MNVKNNFNQVKQEFNNDEKVLESAFRLEAFFKRNRKWLFGALAIGVVLIVSYQIKDYLAEKRALRITQIFDQIHQDGVSDDLMNQLKKEGGELYEFVLLSEALKHNQQKDLEVLQKSSNSFIASYASYELGSLSQNFDHKNYGEFKDLVVLQEGYLLNSRKEFKEASKKLDAIEPTSELRDWALRIGHYGITD
ncbi:hypothetical protein [Helicobacter pametensis]|uniref:hypothetical protein n=1 Tax=Helicobacter pametensis TaxID=95149 RepID=UPI000485DCD8|nr:hypothetical protein [Helicobacter pametensis]